VPGIRVIAGIARGRQLKTPPEHIRIRPILGRIKKSLFDILTEKIAGSVFLDLFAGSGNVGVEALSRGAREVFFVEKEKECIKAIRHNIAMLKFEARAQVVPAWVEDFLKHSSSKYDIIFAGPPYKNEHGMLALSMPAIMLIEKNKLLNDGGWLIVQHHKKEELSDCGSLGIFRQEKYGDTKVTFYRYRSL
jgi:16S rRNA (guanine(966)-N(2))-methyltransferase RsmD